MSGLTDSRHLTHKMQPCPVSCVCTSLAIIMDADVSEMVEKYHQGYREGTVTIRSILNEHGVPFQTFDSLDGASLEWVGAYLVTVPSLNITGGTHQIVVEVTEDDYHIIDPVAGRDGRRYYVKRGEVYSDLEHELNGFIIDAYIPHSYIARAKP